MTLSGEGAISWRVAQEFLNVALHRFERSLTRTLYTEDLQPGRGLRGLHIENPFT